MAPYNTRQYKYQYNTKEGSTIEYSVWSKMLLYNNYSHKGVIIVLCEIRIVVRVDTYSHTHPSTPGIHLPITHTNALENTHKIKIPWYFFARSQGKALLIKSVGQVNELYERR